MSRSSLSTPSAFIDFRDVDEEEGQADYDEDYEGHDDQVDQGNEGEEDSAELSDADDLGPQYSVSQDLFSEMKSREHVQQTQSEPLEFMTKLPVQYNFIQDGDSDQDEQVVNDDDELDETRYDDVDEGQDDDDEGSYQEGYEDEQNAY
jgi:hypothetical protein